MRCWSFGVAVELTVLVIGCGWWVTVVADGKRKVSSGKR